MISVGVNKNEVDEITEMFALHIYVNAITM